MVISDGESTKIRGGGGFLGACSTTNERDEGGEYFGGGDELGWSAVTAPKKGGSGG